MYGDRRSIEPFASRSAVEGAVRLTGNPTLATLSFAARPKIVAKYVGELLLVVSGLTLVPLALAVLDSERDMAWRLAASVIGLGIVGLAATRLRCEERMQANEALAVVALSYLATAVAMVLPFTAQGLSVSDAFFESVSAITTTGLSTVRRVEALPRSFLLLRAWMQWYGGLGIVVLSVALLVGDDAIARRLVDARPIRRPGRAPEGRPGDRRGFSSGARNPRVHRARPRPHTSECRAAA
jgi:Cation transport protein